MGAAALTDGAWGRCTAAGVAISHDRTVTHLQTGFFFLFFQQGQDSNTLTNRLLFFNNDGTVTQK